MVLFYWYVFMCNTGKQLYTEINTHVNAQKAAKGWRSYRDGEMSFTVQGRQDEIEESKHLSSDQQNTNRLEEKLFFLG